MTAHLPPTARSLPIALIRAREGVMGPIRAMLAETGLSEQQWRVLRVLSEHGALDTTTLADRASLLHPSLTRMLASMRKRGLVTQTRSQQDKRRQIVEITKAGRQVIDDNTAEATAIVAQYQKALGRERYEMLLDLLAQLDPGPRSTS